jgi:hypothetical protein
MKAFFYLRIFFISLEFLFLILSFATYMVFGNWLEKKFLILSINKDALQWAIVLPIAISSWILKDGVGVIFPNDNTDKILHDWPDYWKLKVHFDVGIFNCIIFLLPCLGVLFSGTLNKFGGVWLYLIFAFAGLINACTFYYAIIDIRSALIKINK